VLTKPRPHLGRLVPSFQERRWLLSGKPGALWFLERERVTALWALYGPVIVERHIRLGRPGRPINWWRFDNPAGPRCQGESQHQFWARNNLPRPSEKRRRPRRRRDTR
jgi:hypothetical protein